MLSAQPPCGTASNPASVATATASIVVTGSVATKYYYFGSQRVAMRKGGVLYYLYGDHPSLRSGQV